VWAAPGCSDVPHPGSPCPWPNRPEELPLPTVADDLITRLQAWDVQRIFGYPGDGIDGLTAALQRTDGAVDFVQVRHEESAAFMACAYVKYGGAQLGVCLATSGPGAIHLLNGLYDAKADHKPVVAIVGQQPRSALGGSFSQEVDLHSLYKDVASAYVAEIVDPSQARHVIDRACRIALAERSVTAVIVPNDVQMLDAVTEPERAHGRMASSAAWSPALVLPEEDELRRAAEILNEGERVAILVGQGALHAGAEVAEVAELLGAGVAKALLGKAVLPDDLPYVTGAIGLVGTAPSWRMMEQCDTLLMVGTNMPYSEFLPAPGAARGIQIDIDGRMLGIRYPTELNLIGDSAATLRALIPLLELKRDRAWRARIERWVARWWKVVDARAENPADPLNPQLVVRELSHALPDDVMLAVDCGTATGWYARDVHLRPGMSGWLAGNLLTMGNGMPYAIAAKFAHPDRPAVALIGDGAMQMTGLAELVTAAKYWQRWEDPRLVIVVLNNRDLNYVSWEQRTMGGDPKFVASQELPDVPYARYAELLGLAGRRIDEPGQVAGAVREALAADRPFVLDAYVDAGVPPLPPHIERDQAVNIAKALLRGDPDGIGIVRQSLRDLVENVLPHNGMQPPRTRT
jgi:pyruvate dehydrogenase (quinone)